MKDEPDPPEPNMGYTDLELMPAVVVGSFVSGILAVLIGILSDYESRMINAPMLKTPT